MGAIISPQGAAIPDIRGSSHSFSTCLRSAAAQLYIEDLISSLDPQTPDQAYFDRVLHIAAGEGWYSIVKTGKAAVSDEPSQRLMDTVLVLASGSCFVDPHRPI
jgi:hypothetical protein